jgi:hypothetical protein
VEAGEPAGGGAGGKCDEKCPFCQTKELKGYKTKHGMLKDEEVLEKSIQSMSDSITSDKKAGSIFPLSGGKDRTTGWLAKAGVFEDFPVSVAAAPHHIIPGKAAMAPSRLEKWTREDKGKIKQDIGYSIDCAQNGVFLPHLPAIYWTKHAPGTKTPMAKFYGRTWKALSASSKQSIGFLMMGETSLQMHYTDHDDPYAHVDNTQNYDKECKEACNRLADFMAAMAENAQCKDGDGLLYPPYGLVSLINTESQNMKFRITGHPKRWESWVSPLAQNYTHHLQTEPNMPLSSFKGLIERVYG